MATNEEVFSNSTADTFAAETSFYSLPYVATLQQYTAVAYQPTLHAVTSSTGSSGVSGDGFTECVTRLRLETERRVAGQLRTALLQEQAAARSKGKDCKAHANAETDVETATLGESVGSAAGPSPGSRVSSAATGLGSSFRKPLQRSFRQLSAGVGSRNSIQSGGLNSPSMGKQEGKETSSSSPAAPVGAVMAVKLLREGLARSFGWPLPSSTLFSEGRQQSKPEGGGCSNSSNSAQLKGLADTLLSRRSFVHVAAASVSTPLVNVPFASTPLYMELADEEGRQDILLEWMEDVLIFALRQNFNALQTQCLILDSILALQAVEETHTKEGGAEEESDAAWEKRVTEALQDVLCTQTCPTVTRIIETVQQRQLVEREVPDPVQLAEIEYKRQKVTSQKALAFLDAAQAGIPLVKLNFMEDVNVEVEKDATLPALFSMAEAASIVEFITRSVVMHRRLWRLVLAESPSTTAKRPLRPVVEVPLCAYVEDVPSVFLPPLSAFYPVKRQKEVDAQRGVYNDCVAEKRSLFAAKYELPLAALSAEEVAERQALLAAAKQAAADDRDAALNVQECAHVEKAFHLRLQDTMQHNSRLSRGDSASALASAQGKGEGAPAANPMPILSISAPDTTKRKVRSGNAGAKTSMSLSNLLGQSALSADAAAAVQLPPDAAFMLADVEKRVERIAAAVESLPTGNTTGAAGRGKQRKR
ncbi:hypothetical protein ABL78_1054 [Leptomonas seymouri]|uniref:Uncharacterized protein n=1 Tax=Leptomonas seymouri TaxID=5684 RepID=A0A0N1PE66_LEPSE|nr:hypothetical protein ABL78_1054 [Leptomonas seymouri]|eukprot:KPI89791.1 hypothetical protein ABL78_1054 [Leptomonas seymouri]